MPNSNYPYDLAPGNLDLNFGNSGIVTTDIGVNDISNGNADSPLTPHDKDGWSIITDGNGNILAAGYMEGNGSSDFALIRYTADGSLDSSFGDNGIVITNIVPTTINPDFPTDFPLDRDDMGRSVVVDSDGNILVVGQSSDSENTDFALVRYTTNGVLDSNFGDGGMVLTDMGFIQGSSSDDIGYSVVTDSSGNILVGGVSDTNGSKDFTIVRYTATGESDPSFGNGGIVTTDLFGGDDTPYSMTIDANGNILMAGVYEANGSHDFLLTRYTSDGILDTSFGNYGDGIVLTDIGYGSNDIGYSVITDGDGNILVGGVSDASGTLDFTLVRYTADGFLDSSFGDNGIVTTDISTSGVEYGGYDNGSTDIAYDLSIDSVGNILVSGSSDAGYSSDITLVRYTADGVLDTGFGSDGIVTTDIDYDSADVGYSVAIAHDGGILVGGISTTENGNSFTLVRYVSDVAPSPIAITGTPEEDSTLTVDTSELSDADGLPDSSTFYYDWEQSNDGGETWEYLSGGGDWNSALTLGDAHSGSEIRVSVGYQDLAGNDERVSSNPVAIANINDAPTIKNKTELTTGYNSITDTRPSAVAIDGTTAVVGKFNDYGSGNNSGAVYVYNFGQGNWQDNGQGNGQDNGQGNWQGNGQDNLFLETALRPSDGQSGIDFGRSVAIANDTIIVGAPYDSVTTGGLSGNENIPSTGSVYTYTYDDTNGWGPGLKLLAEDTSPVDNFGEAVAFDGNTAIIGASLSDTADFTENIWMPDTGAAYLYDFDGSTWTQAAKLTASDGAVEDRFGEAVAIDGAIALVGASGNDDGGTDSGSAYVYEFDGNSWDEVAKLTADDGEAGDGFGQSLAIANNIAVVGARGDDDGGTDSGAAYVFTFAGGTWNQTAKLTADKGGAGDQFSWSVAIENQTIVVGAYSTNEFGHNTGAVYTYRFDGSAWNQTLGITPEEEATEYSQVTDQLGQSVAIANTTIITAATGRREWNSDDGFGYIFDAHPVSLWGTPAVDSSLSADLFNLKDDDGLPEDPYSYPYSSQWQQSEDGGNTWADIDNAYDLQFTPGEEQVGSQVRVRVDYTDQQGTDETVFSAGVTIECFLTGTRILTEMGEVPVEELKRGDRVQTAEGDVHPIKWIGRQTRTPGYIRNPLRGYPIQIKTGALGNGLPHRDLFVSPDHALLVEGLLINAGALVNGSSILQITPTEPFVYHHIELAQHALLVAEGTAAESYLPQKEDRQSYDNGDEYAQLYPHHDILCYWPLAYPRVSSVRQLPTFVRKHLARIAKTLDGKLLDGKLLDGNRQDGKLLDGNPLDGNRQDGNRQDGNRQEENYRHIA